MAIPKPALLDGISFSQCVRDQNGRLLRITLSADQKFRIKLPLRDISPELVKATLQYEDKYYAQHPGVNPVALARCALEFVRSHRAIAGGSTITMQVARLRFHLQTRSLPGKLVQIIRAIGLERHYTKDQILEAYLNLAPYGRNIEGAGAASQIYFDKPAGRLTGPEAVANGTTISTPEAPALPRASGKSSSPSPTAPSTKPGFKLKGKANLLPQSADLPRSALFFIVSSRALSGGLTPLQCDYPWPNPK